MRQTRLSDIQKLGYLKVIEDFLTDKINEVIEKHRDSKNVDVESLWLGI